MGTGRLTRVYAHVTRNFMGTSCGAICSPNLNICTSDLIDSEQDSPLWSHLEEIEFTSFTPLSGGEGKSAIFLLFNNKRKYLLVCTYGCGHAGLFTALCGLPGPARHGRVLLPSHA